MTTVSQVLSYHLQKRNPVFFQSLYKIHTIHFFVATLCMYVIHPCLPVCVCI